MFRPKVNSHSMQQTNSVNRLYHGHGPQANYDAQQQQQQPVQYEDRYKGSSKEMVPKLVLEEKEQEILAKEETISVSIVDSNYCVLNHIQ